MEQIHEYGTARAADILVVDDQREITELVAEALLDEGYLVRVAHDGANALEAVQERQPDLLLLDVSMPVLTGDEVLRRLRSDGTTRQLPIILMTADRTPERFAELGATQLLRKPFDLRRLSQLVAAYVGD
jgi:CheY-like chemotaxis protein